MNKSKEKTETYKCYSCKKVFKGPPGMTICKRCGHEYVKWVNFKKDWFCDEQDNWKRK